MDTNTPRRKQALSLAYAENRDLYGGVHWGVHGIGLGGTEQGAILGEGIYSLYTVVFFLLSMWLRFPAEKFGVVSREIACLTIPT